MENLYNEINKYHLERHLALENSSGGEIRKARGSLVEELVKSIWEGLGEGHKAVLQQKHEIYFDSIDKSMKVGCDVDCYKDEKLACIVECKAYLEKCYLERAVSDFRYLNETTKVPKIVVALEESIDPNTYEIIKHLHSDVFDGMYILCSGKRNASKPMYKSQYLKPIERELFNNLINFFKEIK